MPRRPIRFASYLAPNMFRVYRYIAEYAGRRLGYPTQATVGTSFDAFERGETDVGFICSPPYVMLRRRLPPPVELLAAPVLHGSRYGGKPVGFSDVIVHRDSRFQSFDDLRGGSWAYNDLDSHSGYNMTRYRLIQMGQTRGFFNRVVEAGFHQSAIRQVAAGKVDASAIDSQVLEIEFRSFPALREHLRVVDVMGPSTIQPVIAASRLPASLKGELRQVFLEMGRDPAAREHLKQGLVDRFVAVMDSDYDEIRMMLDTAEQVGYRALY